MRSFSATVVASLLLCACDDAGNNAQVIASLREKQPQCRKNVEQLAGLGVRLSRDANGTRAEYDESLWDRLVHEDKIRAALLIYCADMPESGQYAVFITGLHNGKILASVVNGNYFDN